MKKDLVTLITVVIAWLAVMSCLHMGKRVRMLQKDKESLSVELAHARIPMQRDTIHDSIEVVKQTVVEVVPGKMKEALAEQAQVIRDLKLKVGQLESAQTTSVQVSDSVPARHDRHKDRYYYKDQWAELELSLEDSTFYYNIRDSLGTYVYREYKHRFLWWRWGTKGYRLKIVNFNPHATVKYNSYVKAER